MCIEQKVRVLYKNGEFIYFNTVFVKNMVKFVDLSISLVGIEDFDDSSMIML